MAKKLTSAKARKILHDKSVHGHPLTEQQRKFFGAIAGGAKPYKAEDGGWLDKYEEAQVGKNIPKYDTRPSTGDIASYYPAIKRMKEQPKIDQTKAEAKKREEQERSRKAIENQPTIGPAKPDYRTDREKAAQRNEMARREAMRNSALAQTFGSFTPSGSPDAGVIGAETFVNMNPLITGPFLSGTRLYGQASGQNPYGFGESTAGNVLGAVGLLGDVAFVKSAVPSGTASQLGRYITTETPVKNVYKINPFAEKLKDANKSYRVAGRDAYEDFVNTGGVRSVTPMPEPGMSFAERIQQRPTGFPSFQKGFADLRYLPEEGGVVFETSLPTFRRGDINPVTGQRIKGRHYAHRVIDPKTGKTVTNIPASDVKVYEGTPDWLRGFRPINVSEAAPKSGASNLFRGLSAGGDEFNFYQRLDTGVESQLAGAAMGLQEKLLSLFGKGKGRSFSEMFPLSKSAKTKAIQQGEIANIKGEQFVKDWAYDQSGTIQPDVKKKIVDIMFSEGSPYLGGFESNFQTLQSARNPLFNVNTPNKVMSTRFSDVINNPELNELEKIRVLNNRAGAVGVNYAGDNYFPASYTFQNMGMYNFPYSTKLSTAVHEGAHTMQQLGAYEPQAMQQLGVYGTGKRGTGFGDMLAKYDPKYKYFTPNLKTQIGRDFAEVMKTPKKGRSNWETSPIELHSELMSARKRLVDHYTEAGHSYDDALNSVRNQTDKQLDWMIKKQNLNRFFKKGISQEKKREMLRLLPAAVPAVGAIGAMGEEEEQQRDGGWLDKYEQGGLVLKQKTHDNYGKKPNPNDPDVSLPKGFKGWAYNTKGRNYSPAWGGQFKDGGPVTPMSRESYDALRKEHQDFYTPKVPYRPQEDDRFDAFYKYKTKDLKDISYSQGSGWLIKGEDSELFVPSEKGAPMPKKAEKKAGKKTFVEDYMQTGDHPLKQVYSDAILNFVKEEARNAALPPYQRLQVGGNIMPAMAGANQTIPMYQMGGSIPGAVGFTYARTQSPAPSNGPYAKKTKASAQNGKEMKFYQAGLDFKPKTISQDGSEIPVDSMGYWNPDNWGSPVIIPSTDITMEGVDQPLIGISDTGDTQMMYPGEDYEFDGEYVTEYPVAKKGISVNKADQAPIEKLDQLLNFTNYNKPTKGGWLDKYN